MASPRARLPVPRRTLLLLGTLGAVLALFLARSRHPGLSTSPRTTNDPHPEAAPDPEALRQFLAIESAENEVDRTVLKDELVAQEHGHLIERWWESLEAAPDALALLQQAPVRSLACPPLGNPESLPLGIRRWRPSATHSVPPAAVDWRERIAGWRRAGWRLAASEWRHVAFTPAGSDRPAVSRCVVHLDATRTNPVQERLQIEARVRFAWPVSPPAPGVADFGEVTVEELEVTQREGPPAFRAAFEREIAPFPRTSWIDPLIVHDLDGDGRPELLLVARNLVLRRSPDGTWSDSELSPHHPGLLFSALLADFSGDGLPDLLLAVRQGLVLLPAGPQGRFDLPPTPVWTAPERLEYAQALTGGDVDADGDLDVFLGQYRTPYSGGQMPRPFFDALDGPPAYLLRNDGAGRFSDETAAAGLETRRHRRSYGASFVDLDADGDLDLWVSSDFAGADVYANDGRGRFTEVTGTWLDERHAFGMSHACADFDADGRLDALLVGMPQPTADLLDSLELERPGFEPWRGMRSQLAFGSRLFFGGEDGLRQRPAGRRIARSGWAWSAAVLDLDQDRFPDLYIANGHETRAAVRDYEREFWTHDIYVGDSTPRPAVDTYFAAKFAVARARQWSYGGHDRNRFYLNLGGTDFAPVGHLLDVALGEDSRNAIAADFDGDGDLDLAVTTFEIWPRVRQTLRIFENTLPPVGHWIGLRLPQGRGVPSPVGALATVADRLGVQVGTYLLGDGYRSQSPPILRFGLGEVSTIDHTEIRWPGGRKVRLDDLQADRIHDVPPPPGPADR